MGQIQNAQYFPYFIPPPPHYIPPPPNHPPPRHPPSPPKVTPPPPPPPSPPHHPPSPPPPPKLPVPPPPPHTFPPPHPHPVSPPPPPPPSHPISPPSPPPHHSTVIIFVFVSVGGVFFLAFLAAALFCFIKKRKKTTVQESDRVRIDEHMRIHQDIVPGPHGTQTVVLTIDEDKHIEEEIHKSTQGKESTSLFKHQDTTC